MTNKTNRSTEAGVSIRPSDGQQFGLLDDFDGVITDAKWVPFNYGGKGTNVLSLAVEIDSDELEKPIVQNYSLGEAALKKYTIAPGNIRLKPNSADIHGLPQGSNGLKFLASFASAASAVGFPEDRMGDDCTVLVGFKCHFQRVANINKGITKKEGEKDNTILLITRVLELPEQTIKKTRGRGRPTTQTATTPGVVEPVAPNTGAQNAQNAVGVVGSVGVDGVSEKAFGLVMDVLMGNKNVTTKQQLAQTAYQKLNGDSDRNAVITLITQDQYLGGGDKPWKFDGNQVTL